MPYLKAPANIAELSYGTALVRGGELVLVNECDIVSLLSEGWLVADSTLIPLKASEPVGTDDVEVDDHE